MKIIITGCDGYCGWPTLLKLRKEFPEAVIHAVDDLSRRYMVEEIGSESIIPIVEYSERREMVEGKNVKVHNMDLTQTNPIVDLISQSSPDIILHLASQPSAPYADIDLDHFNFTQHNNTQMLRNIIWGISKSKYPTHLIVTTTTGIYGAPHFPIPEGNIEIDGVEYPYPTMSGSWYHMSRGFDASNLWLASKKFDFPITEFRTSIVSGSSTEETRQSKKHATRFDYDFYFGVVINRFVSMALAGQPLTIYGKGQQRKPMISLEDMCRSLVEVCKLDTSRRENQLEIYNQLEGTFSIKEMAETVKKSLMEKFNFNVDVTHIQNPRIEDEEHDMVMYNEKFVNLIGEFKCSVLDSISQICGDVYKFKDNFRSFQ